MKINLKIGEKYLTKPNIEFNYIMRNIAMFGVGTAEERLIYYPAKIFNRALIEVKGIHVLNDFFSRIIFTFDNGRDLIAYSPYLTGGLPHFLVYDDSKLDITDEVRSSMFTNNKNKLIALSKFNESFIEYDPILVHKVAAADAMINNANAVILKQNEKIQKIYENYFNQKKEYNRYDEMLKTVVDSDVVEKQSHTDFFKEPESSVSNQQEEQSQDSDNGEKP